MDYSFLDINKSLQGLKNKSFRSFDLVESCIKRIKDIEPKLHAFVSFDEEKAIQKAKRMDQLIVDKKNFEKYPLLGVPISIKDNFCTKDFRSTASSSILEYFVPPYNASVVQKLNDAGAIIIGKTNMDAWAHGTSTESSDFFTTFNPWDLNKLPGGSSGGSAASVASDEIVASIGSETAGSIRIPASWCSVVGLKPTYGRVSRYGLIAMASSLDSPGPITKTVWDSALILEVISGQDGYDATLSENKVQQYSKLLDKNIKGLKVGIPKEYLNNIDKDISDKLFKTIKLIKSLGVEVVEISLFDPKYAISVYTILQRSEVSSNLSRYDGIRYGKGREFFGKEAKRRIMLGSYCLSAGYYDEYYIKAQKIRTIICQDFERAFSKVDFIIGPVAPCTALPIGSSKSDPMFGEVMDKLVEPSSIAGLCGISIPISFDKQNMPIGLQIIGNKFDEANLLNFAEKIEKSLNITKKPNI